MTAKEIKKEIRKLAKLKKACRVGTDERKALNKQIKDLKEALLIVIGVDKQKEPIIEKIKKLDNSFDKLGINLNKFTKEELEKHLKNILKK